MKERLLALGIHVFISLTVAALAAAVVFLVWYPYPYGEVSGGRELFFILMGVDVVAGPLLTFILYRSHKPRRELVIDLGLVGLLQMAALAYGLWTVAMARPVHLAFEYTQFRVVHAVDVPPELLKKAPADLQAMPWWGPTPLSLRAFTSEAEKMDATMAALNGLQLGVRPDLWQNYDAGRAQVLAAGKPLAALKAKFPQHASSIEAVCASVQRDEDSLAYVPMVARKVFWTVVIDAKSADILGFLPIDSF